MAVSSIVYGFEGCEACARVKRTLDRFGNKYQSRDLARLSAGERLDTLDVDALAQLHMQGGRAPVVILDGRTLSWADVEELANASN